MNIEERHEIAAKHGVCYKAIYERERTGWTDDEIRNGRRFCYIDPYAPQFPAKTKLTSGAALFMVLILEVVTALANLGKRLPPESGDFMLAGMVLCGLWEQEGLDKHNGI
jgi:hypothetical protein